MESDEGANTQHRKGQDEGLDVIGDQEGRVETSSHAAGTDTGGTRPIESTDGWTLFVTGIHEEAQEDDIYDKFADFGDVKSVIMPSDKRTGYARGYALVLFGDKKAAQEAIKELDGTNMLTKKLSVDWAFVSRGSGGGGGSSRRRGGGKGGGDRRERGSEDD